ncbi:MAG: glycosyltransferase family 4 protein [Candidatus Diapherotrites archaeon]|nr:glycosyltransferase family 4 protein [Candidatus Diapherotrites archaeon]
MKVLLTNYFGPGFGGAEQSTQIIAQGLIEKGHEAVIASTKKYETSTIQFKKFLPLTVFQNTFLKTFLTKTITKEKIDIVHAQDRLTSFAAVLAAKQTGRPCVVHFRDYWFACTKSTCLKPNLQNCECSLTDIIESNPIYRVPWELLKMNLIRKNLHTINKADKKIAISNAVHKKMMEKNIGENTIIIPNPVDVKAFQKKNLTQGLNSFKGKQIVLFCGRFSYEKGISNLLKIIEDVGKEKKDALFVLVGTGPLKQACEKFFKEKNARNVFFTGNIPFEKLVELYKLCNLVLFPSVWEEPFGRVAIEAMAAGKPVIASNVGGIKETVEDNKSGFLLEPNNLNEWVKKTCLLLDDKNLAKNFGNYGKKIVEKNFEKNVVISKIIDVYDEVM